MLLVTHDDDDGAWQFLCGGPHEPDDGRLMQLAGVPRGWRVERDCPDSPWVHEPDPPPPDDGEGVVALPSGR